MGYESFQGGYIAGMLIVSLESWSIIPKLQAYILYKSKKTINVHIHDIYIYS